MVWEALKAAKILNKNGISARVINIHTIKPIDEQIIINAAKETGLIITVEEHQVMAGFGSAIAEVVVKSHPVPMEMVGMNDCFGESGKPEELMQKYGLVAGNIAAKAKIALGRK